MWKPIHQFKVFCRDKSLDAYFAGSLSEYVQDETNFLSLSLGFACHFVLC